jgi:hypothetical protein
MLSMSLEEHYHAVITTTLIVLMTGLTTYQQTNKQNAHTAKQ